MPSSKRDVLSTLQAVCTVDYLRIHGLNASVDVALRKVNKTKLQNAWEGYEKYCLHNSTNANSKRSDNDALDASPLTTNEIHDENWNCIEKTFRSILSETNGNSNNAIAAYLHESCDAELPCWGWDNLPSQNTNSVQHIFLFLGAVRDMTSGENDALQYACTNVGIPLVPCRLGQVPEFTSKIVSVARFHYYRGCLGHGLVELWKRKDEKCVELPSKKRKLEPNIAIVGRQRTIHNIVVVPMKSSSLTTDAEKRDRIHWCMIRMVVCALWRSKLASSEGGTPLNNGLTFLFSDGASIALEQKDFISSMAENHKAAPSELQILEQLCRHRDAVSTNDIIEMESKGKSVIKRVCLDLVESHTTPKNSKGKQLKFVLNILPSKQSAAGQTSLLDMAYSHEYKHDIDDREYTLFTIQDIGIHNVSTDDNNSKASIKKATKIRKHLLKAFQSTDVALMDHPMLASGSLNFQEEEASTIIMLQHLEYQRRLLSLLIAYESERV
jgi:hypothetical protein